MNTQQFFKKRGKKIERIVYKLVKRAEEINNIKILDLEPLGRCTPPDIIIHDKSFALPDIILEVTSYTGFHESLRIRNGDTIYYSERIKGFILKKQNRLRNLSNKLIKSVLIWFEPVIKEKVNNTIILTIEKKIKENIKKNIFKDIDIINFMYLEPNMIDFFNKNNPTNNTVINKFCTRNIIFIKRKNILRKISVNKINDVSNVFLKIASNIGSNDSINPSGIIHYL